MNKNDTAANNQSEENHQDNSESVTAKCIAQARTTEDYIWCRKTGKLPEPKITKYTDNPVSYYE